MVGKSFDSSMSMRLFPAVFAILFTGLVSVSLFGCQTDVGLDERRFQCQSNSDCLDGYVCDQTESVCTPAGLAKDASHDVEDSSTDTGRDAEERDAVADTTDASDTTDAPDAPDTSPSVCSSYAECNTGEDCVDDQCVDISQPCNVGAGFYVRRCDPVSEDKWGIAAVIDRMDFPGAPDSCCFDVTGGGDIDNALGTLLADTTQLDLMNEGIAEAIDAGEWTAALEFPGLEETDGARYYGFGWHSQRHSIDPDGIAHIEVDAADPVGGTFSRYYFPYVTTTGSPETILHASHGRFFVVIPLLGPPLEFPVVRAQVEAEIHVVSGEDGDGLQIERGKLGGALPLGAIVERANKAATNCDCLTSYDPLISWDPDSSSAICHAEADADDVCTNSSDEQCAALVEGCRLVPTLSTIADVDLDADENNDALSFGVYIDAEAAVIDGMYQQ